LKLKLREADLALVVYDATDEETWRAVESTWLPLVLEAFDEDLAKGILVIGTKVDLLLAEDREALKERKCSDPFLHSTVSRYLLSDRPLPSSRYDTHHSLCLSCSAAHPGMARK
jgi:GTPase SAR1 family protein